MERCQEFIGVRCVKAANAYGEGKHLYNMHLTDTEIIRCRDCLHFVTHGADCLCNRFHVGYWDAEEEQDVIVRCVVNPDGFCAWAKRREQCDM